MAEGIRYATGASCDRRPQGNVELRLHFYEDGEPHLESVVISYEEAFGLAKGLMGACESLADSRMRSVAAGDCATCGNRRMVNVERHGRPWTEHCPDCHPAFNAATPFFIGEPRREA